MKGVILDADSLGTGDVDLRPITSTLDEWHVHGFTVAEDTTDRIADADVVLSNKVRLGRAQFEAAPSLKLVSVMATGTNNIDLDAARDHDVKVCNAVGYATPSVVQHTINLMLTLSTNLLDYVDDVRRGAWQASNVFCLLDHPITELCGKYLGIVGYGELGKAVATVARAFGMNVLVCARPGTKPGQDRIALEELLPQVDYLSLHCPLTDENRHLIDSNALRRMKPGAFLINTARGGLVDSGALVNALENGVIAGAAVDVLDSEPPGSDELLLQTSIPNLIVTPHNAWGARESRARLVQQMKENVECFLAGKPVRALT